MDPCDVILEGHRFGINVRAEFICICEKVRQADALNCGYRSHTTEHPLQEFAVDCEAPKKKEASDPETEKLRDERSQPAVRGVFAYSQSIAKNA